MKTVSKITIVLLVCTLAIMAGCGKRKRSGNTASGAPNTPTQDFSTLAYNSGAKEPGFLMSDYIFMGSIDGDKDNKRVYAQMNLFFIKAKANTASPAPTPAIDTNFQDATAEDATAIDSKKHQYEFFYREFVTCQDGPAPYLELDKIHMSYLRKISGEAILIKGGGLNAVNLGTATKFQGKGKQGATLVLGQVIHGDTSPVNVSLNFKKPNETLAHDEGFVDPQDPDRAKAIAAIDCSKPVGANTAKTIPYGPQPQDVTPTQQHQNGKNKNGLTVKTIQQDNVFSVQPDNQDG